MMMTSTLFAGRDDDIPESCKIAKRSILTANEDQFYNRECLANVMQQLTKDGLDALLYGPEEFRHELENPFQLSMLPDCLRPDEGNFLVTGVAMLNASLTEARGEESAVSYKILRDEGSVEIFFKIVRDEGSVEMFFKNAVLYCMQQQRVDITRDGPTMIHFDMGDRFENNMRSYHVLGTECLNTQFGQQRLSLMIAPEPEQKNKFTGCITPLYQIMQNLKRKPVEGKETSVDVTDFEVLNHAKDDLDQDFKDDNFSETGSEDSAASE